jgi:hypothetical protein
MGRWMDLTRLSQNAGANSANSANSENSDTPISPIGTNDTNGTACLICGQPADDSNSNLVHGDPDYRRVHFTPDCYDAWFKAAFGKTPAPTTA